MVATFDHGWHPALVALADLTALWRSVRGVACELSQMWLVTARSVTSPLPDVKSWVNGEVDGGEVLQEPRAVSYVSEKGL